LVRCNRNSEVAEEELEYLFRWSTNETEFDFFFTKSDKLTSLNLVEPATAPNERNSNESASPPADAVPWMVNGTENPLAEGWRLARPSTADATEDLDDERTTGGGFLLMMIPPWRPAADR
jgi:hypothetical protein